MYRSKNDRLVQLNPKAMKTYQEPIIKGDFSMSHNFEENVKIIYYCDAEVGFITEDGSFYLSTSVQIKLTKAEMKTLILFL